MPSLSLAALDTLEGYSKSFMNPGLWRPFVEDVGRVHGWTCEQVRPGSAGTFPTFIVDERRVVKFFGPLFDGETCWRVEHDCAGMMTAMPEFLVARLLAEGEVEAAPDWHYLVFDFIPGLSIGEIYGQVPFESKVSLVRWLGTCLPRMYRLPALPGSNLPALSIERMRDWFARRWPETRPKWPAHLVGQVEGYLRENAAFIQCRAEGFTHADLTQDHFLGRLENGNWTTLAVIDFGDAMLGNVYYELAALHLDLFDCDTRLLRVFCESYGLAPDPDFIRKAMTTALMHQFDVFGPLFEWRPRLAEIRTLEELAETLWQFDDLSS